MTSLPITSIDNIVSYLKPKEQMVISDKYKFIAIMKSKVKIRKVVAQWVIGYSISMNIDYYEIPKIVYKKYYPMKYRQSFIETALDLLVSQDKERYNLIADYMSDENLSQVQSFNNSVDLLTERELFFIGW